MNVLKKIFSPLCLSFSLSILIYTYYRSEISWGGNRSEYYFTYYILSFTLILFSIISFFLGQKIKEYLIISGLSFIVSVYIFEGYLSYEKKPPQAKIYEKETGKKWDDRQRSKIYKDMKKLNNKITVTVHPSYYINRETDIFPLSGISNSKTIYCNENGYFSIYQSDRYGFNNPDEEWDSNEIEYLLVGDSMTHGACVNRPNDFGSVLRNLSNKTVLNLGYGGNAPLTQYATLREFISPKVKKVLWIFVENDVGGLIKELNAKNKLLTNYISDLNYTQNLKLRQDEVNALGYKTIEKEYTEIRKVKQINFLKLNTIREKFNNLLPEKYRPYEDFRQVPLETKSFKMILKLAKDLVAQNNSKLYFVYLPLCERYKTKTKGCYYKKGEYDDSNYRLLKKIVNELDIPFIDTHTEVFLKEKFPTKLFPFELNKHYNVEGFRKVSEATYNLTKD